MAKSREILGHPRGLFVLFFTEMWERFSYYGMRALLVLYMTEYLFVEVPDKGKIVWGYPTLKAILSYFFGEMSIQATSSQIYGYYTGLVYLTPILGGWLADRYLGQRRAVYVGGFLMAIGHFLMAVESMFIPALLFLIFGNGFFKPNISTQVGALYPDGDERRDKAFTIFYMGINLGAFFSPLVCGTLGQKVGWHYGFTTAGVGMVLGLAVYHFGRKELPVEAPPAHQLTERHELPPLQREDFEKIGALVVMCVLTIFFWGVYEQQGNVLQLWAEHNTDWNFFGFIVPSTWFQSFNPFMIFVLAPVLDIFWTWQAKRGTEPSSVNKMGFGCILAALGYVLMYIAARVIGHGQGHFMWLTGTVFLFTVGELYISPIGLSLVTKLAPARMISMMMGVWLLSSFFGNSLTGILGGYYEQIGAENFFLLMMAIVACAGVLFLLANRPLKRLVP